MHAPSRRRAVAPSTARGYLNQAKSHPNLTIRTHAMTNRVPFDGKRAVGVEWLEGDSTIPNPRNGQRRSAVMCRRDCLTRRSCNAPASATLELLAEFDLPAGASNTGVSKSSGIIWRCICNMSAKNQFSLSTLPAVVETSRKSVQKWLFGGTGVGASNHFEAGGFIRSRERIVADLQSFPASSD